MPAPLQYALNKTTNSREFEYMAKDYAEKIWAKKFSHYGRNGQNQHGIDILSDDGSIAIQCKNYLKSDKESQNRFLQNIHKDYKRASSYFPGVKQFVIVTALDRETSLQDAVLKWEEEQNAADEKVGKEILFWDDICEVITQYPELLKKYYPGLMLPVNTSTLIM